MGKRKVTPTKNKYRKRRRELQRQGQRSPIPKPVRKAVRPGSAAASSHKGKVLGAWTKEQMKAAWVDHYVHNWSQSEAARRNQVPTSTFKDRVRRIKSALKVNKDQDLTPFFCHMSGGKQGGGNMGGEERCGFVFSPGWSRMFGNFF